MISKILALLCLAAAAFLSFLAFPESWSEKELAQSILCRGAANFGRIDIIEKHIPLLKNNLYRRDANTSLLLALKNIGSDADFQNAKARIGDNFDAERFEYETLIRDMRSLKNGARPDEGMMSRVVLTESVPYRAAAAAHAAAAFLAAGDKDAYLRHMNAAYDTITHASAAMAEEQIFSIVELCMTCEDFENFLRFLKLLNDSDEKKIFIFSAAGIKGFQAAYAKVYADRAERTALGSLASPVYFSFTMPRYGGSDDYEKLEKAFMRIGNSFGLNWKMREKWPQFGYPLIAYLGGVLGESAIEKRYWKKALSEDQLYDMRSNYVEYVSYTSKVLAVSGDWRRALELIDTMHPEAVRMRILRQGMRRLSAKEDSLDALSEAILKKP